MCSARQNKLKEKNIIAKQATRGFNYGQIKNEYVHIWRNDKSIRTKSHKTKKDNILSFFYREKFRYCVNLMTHANANMTPISGASL